MRIRITFSKTEAMRFTGHLDLHRTWERTVRRARLPLAYSQGFNPHPHINLASALPLGFTGHNEVVDIWLEQDLPLPEVQTALQRSAPPGIQITSVTHVDDGRPALQTELESSEFTITLTDPFPELEARMAELLEAPSLIRRRRDKEYDLRPLILELARLPDAEGGLLRLRVRLSAREGATGRPEEVLSSLGYPPEKARVHRERLVFNP